MENNSLKCEGPLNLDICLSRLCYHKVIIPLFPISYFQSGCKNFIITGRCISIRFFIRNWFIRIRQSTYQSKCNFFELKLHAILCNNTSNCSSSRHVVGSLKAMINVMLILNPTRRGGRALRPPRLRIAFVQNFQIITC